MRTIVSRANRESQRLSPTRKPPANILPRKSGKNQKYDHVVVQDIKFEAHNTMFLKEKYYSPSLNRTWLAPLTSGYDGEFGPSIKALAIKLYFDSKFRPPHFPPQLGGVFLYPKFTTKQAKLLHLHG